MSPAKKVVILTGAGNGIGLATAINLLSNLALVVAVDMCVEKLEEIQVTYPESLAVVTGDISQRTTSEVAVKTALFKFGKLDCIILNAGILPPVGLVAETKVEDWKRLFDVNFFALLHTIQLALPHLRGSKGSIIMTSSGVSIRSSTSWIAYACSKRAMNGLCEGLTLEEPDVCCVCITPGIVDTGMQEEVRVEHKTRMPAEQYNWLHQLHDSGSLVQPEQPASTFASLVFHGIPLEVKGGLVPWNDPRIVAS